MNEQSDLIAMLWWFTIPDLYNSTCKHIGSQYMLYVS